MRTKKVLIASILLIFLIVTVSAKPFSIIVEVKNASSPNNPVTGASVTISGSGSSWQGLITNSQGRTPNIDLDRPVGTYYFDISITKEGFQDKTLNNVQLQVLNADPPFKIYTLATVFLTPVGAGPVCNNNGTCDQSRGETTENCPADCPLSSGIVSDIRIVIPQQGQTNVQCPQEYAERGAFNDAIFNTLHKLCVKYVPLSGYVQGNTYVRTVYLQPRIGSGPACESGDTPIGTPFSGGTTYLQLCIKKDNINNLGTDEYLIDATISNTGTCTSNYNKPSPNTAFTDYTGGLHRMCAKIQNYAGQSGNCNLTNPKWMISNPLTEITSAVGWVDFQGDYSTYPFQNGTRNLILYVQAEGCKEERVKFEIYKDESTSPGNGEKKYVISLSDWYNGYKFAPWNPEWTPAGIGNPDLPNYYSFKAMVDGAPAIQSSFSNSLTVTKPPAAECRYQENSNQDDELCIQKKGKGFVCVRGNYCGTPRCESDNDCSNNEICCPTGETNCQEKTCVQCYTNFHCTNSQNFGENYACNLTSNKCYSTKPCEIEKPIWIGESGNALPLIDEKGDFITYKGFVDSKNYQKGTTVNIKTITTGCENVEDIIFIVTEERGFIPILNPKDPGRILDELEKLRRSKFMNSEIIEYLRYQPPWALELNSFLGEGNTYKYRVYAVSKSNPNIRSEYSDILQIGMPNPAECHYSDESDKDDKECLDKYGTGKICSSGNICIEQCKSNADCIANNLPPLCAITQNGIVGAMLRTDEDSPLKFREINGAISGKCYECFTDEHCSSNQDKKYCAPSNHQKKFKCVECKENSHCPVNSDGNPGVCINGECTINCDPKKDPQNPNIDCQAFKVQKTEAELLKLDRQKRAELKGKEICDPETKVCVQCNDNWNGRTQSGCTVPGSCCFIGTACLIEENRCVQCTEDSICGQGNHCNKEKHICESGFAGGGILGGGKLSTIILAAGGAFAGFTFMGPTGALIGGLLGMALGGGLGNGGGNIMGGIGGIGNILNLIGGIGS